MSQETSQQALESIDTGTIRERVLEFLKRRGGHGATDEELEHALELRKGTGRARRVELVKASQVVDSTQRRETETGRMATVWVVSRAMGPENPLQSTQMGYAMALSAIALEVLTGERHRLLWCVDLKRDVGDDADEPLDPTAHQPETKWGSVLFRFRAALDRQPWVGQTCKLGMRVRHSLRSTGAIVEAQYSLPWCVDLTTVAAWPPAVGCWRLWPEPPVVTDDLGRKTGDLEGDRLPDTFWYDGIPF